jgi:hypothetical protein
MLYIEFMKFYQNHWSLLFSALFSLSVGGGDIFLNCQIFKEFRRIKVC